MLGQSERLTWILTREVLQSSFEIVAERSQDVRVPGNINAVLHSFISWCIAAIIAAHEGTVTCLGQVQNKMAWPRERTRYRCAKDAIERILRNSCHEFMTSSGIQ